MPAAGVVFLSVNCLETPCCTGPLGRSQDQFSERSKKGVGSTRKTCCRKWCRQPSAACQPDAKIVWSRCRCNFVCCWVCWKEWAQQPYFQHLVCRLILNGTYAGHIPPSWRFLRHIQTQRLAWKAWEEWKEWRMCQSSTSRALQDKGLVKKPRAKLGRDLEFVQRERQCKRLRTSWKYERVRDPPRMRITQLNVSSMETIQKVLE